MRRKRKIDIARLEQDVAKYPDKTRKQRAQEFVVVPSSIYDQLQRLNIRRKNSFGIEKEIIQIGCYTFAH